MLGGNSLSGLGIEGPGRAYWRGRGESVTRGDRRQCELEFGVHCRRSPALPNRRRDYACIAMKTEGSWPFLLDREEAPGRVSFCSPKQSHFVPAPTRPVPSGFGLRVSFGSRVSAFGFASLIQRATARHRAFAWETHLWDSVPNSLWKFSSTVRARDSSGSLRSSEAKRYTATRFAG